MEKFERLSFIEATKADEEHMLNKRKTFGLYPYLILLLLIMTVGVGILFTNQDISKKIIEKNSLINRIDLIQNTNNVISKEIEDTTSRKEKLFSQLSEKKTKIDNLKLKLKDTTLSNELIGNDLSSYSDRISTHKVTLQAMKESIPNYQEEFKRLSQLHQNYITESKASDIPTHIIDTKEDFSFLLELTGANRLSLCYSSDKDGFNIDIFHKMCDSVSPSLVLYETSYRERIGAYTELQWNGEDGEYDDNAMLFNLERKTIYNTDDIDKKGKNVLPNRNLFPSFGAKNDKYDLFVYELNEDFSEDHPDKDPFIKGHSDYPVCFEKNDKAPLTKMKDFSILYIEVYQVK